MRCFTNVHNHHTPQKVLQKPQTSFPSIPNRLCKHKQKPNKMNKNITITKMLNKDKNNLQIMLIMHNEVQFLQKN